MAGLTGQRAKLIGRNQAAVQDPVWVRWLLIVISIGFVGLFLALPLLTVFQLPTTSAGEASSVALL